MGTMSSEVIHTRVGSVMGTLQIEVLGPLEVDVDGRSVALGGPRARTVFAALVVGLNHAVSIDNLVASVWGDHPPEHAIDTLQSIVSRLRGELGHDVIELIDHSYRLVADPAAVDSIRFERLLERASGIVPDDASRAAAMMIEALALWRGVPFGDLSDVVFLEPEVRRLEALRLSAIEVRLEADVACGRLTSAIASLEAETLENPYRERLWYLLVLALARDGRRVEALRACQQIRAILGEVGLEPSTDLTELEAMVIQESPMVRSHLARGTGSDSSGPTQKIAD